MEAVESKLVAFLALKTLPYSVGLPSEYSFDRDGFYARKCYADCYEDIMNQFQRPHMREVTVTGTLRRR